MPGIVSLFSRDGRVVPREVEEVTTEIEKYLFKKDGTHGVVEITLAEKRVLVSVAPWERLASVVTAEFMEAKIASIEVYADGSEDLNLPWDIIGFDSYPLADQRWRFTLHCAGVEYVFEARWPRLLTTTNGVLPES
jgi:hypothetical protein